MENYEIEVTVRAPETAEGRYPERKTLAELKLVAEPQEAFEVYRAALERLTTPKFQIRQGECGASTPFGAKPEHTGFCRLPAGHVDFHSLDPVPAYESYCWANASAPRT